MSTSSSTNSKGLPTLDLELGRPRLFLPTISPVPPSCGPLWKDLLMLDSLAGPGPSMGAIGTIPPTPPETTPDSALTSPPAGSFATGVRGGGITSPRAIAAAFLASMSALEGRPRFFG